MGNEELASARSIAFEANRGQLHELTPVIGNTSPDRALWEFLEMALGWDYINYYPSGKPKRCRRCSSTNMSKITGDTTEEFRIVCDDCNLLIGYWEHGSYDPCFGDLTGTL